MAVDFSWQDGDQVLFLGGQEAEDPHGYARLVPVMVTARYPERNIRYTTGGMGGNRVGAVVERLDNVITMNEPPTWILVDIGLNDVHFETSGTPLGRFRELYDTLLMRLLNTKATLACLTTTVNGEELDNDRNQALVGYNDAIRELAFARGVRVIDVNTDLRDAIRRAVIANPDFRYTDNGLNLNIYGHYLVATSILRELHYSL